MLRRWAGRREALATAGIEAGASPQPLRPGAPIVLPEPVAPDKPPTTASAEVAPNPSRLPFRINKKRIALVVFLMLFCAMAAAYSQKDKLTPKLADTSRDLIGDENTARVEGYYFRVSDKRDKTKYRFFGAKENPFLTNAVAVQFVAKTMPHVVVYVPGANSHEGESVLTADNLGPTPMVLPATKPLQDSLQPGEGVWTTAGLPHSTPSDALMAKTFIRPDKSRPYALVGLLLMDSRRIKLNMVAGTVDPGPSVKGTGVLPADKYANLLLAWNGGFKGAHGSYGMFADGKTYLPLRNGLGTVAVTKDGTIKIGEWGRDFVWEEGMLSVRQNVVPLVIDGEVSRRVTEGNDTWGYVGVNSSEFITWRSGLGITKDGNLIYAAGNSLSAESLAQALWAAGAYSAMQLDINSPYVLMGTFDKNPDGSLKASKFMDTMADTPSRFLRTQDRDFFYATLDESRYHN